MKQTFYIFCFALLGLLVAAFMHGVMELVYLAIVFGHPEQFGDSFWWTEWSTIHDVGGLLLWILGPALGAYAGVRYWRIIYVESKRK